MQVLNTHQIEMGLGGGGRKKYHVLLSLFLRLWKVSKFVRLEQK